jgi:nitrogen PTS system EIIA component
MLNMPIDLKIKDVAELLHVSETTIRRWLLEGKIPAYRLNHQYRFCRIEIENWMMSCKQNPVGIGFPPASQEQIFPSQDNKEVASQRGGLQQFSLYRAIHKGGVLTTVSGETKEEIIRGAMKLVSQKLGMDAEVLSDLLLDREKLAPTALNHGIAVPHTRDLLLQGPFDVVVAVFPQKAIEYGALDGMPVHTLFFLFASSDKRHLHLLAKLAHLSSNQNALSFFQTKPNKDTLLEYIREWESHIRQI